MQEEVLSDEIQKLLMAPMWLEALSAVTTLIAFGCLLTSFYLLYKKLRAPGSLLALLSVIAIPIFAIAPQLFIQSEGVVGSNAAIVYWIGSIGVSLYALLASYGLLKVVLFLIRGNAI